MKNRIMSFLMAVTMTAVSLMPSTAFAKDTAKQTTAPSTTTAGQITTVSDGTQPVTDPITGQVTADGAEVQKSLEEQQKELEENLKLVEEKLAELEKSSKGTQEYIDTLDRKIGYMNNQLTVLESQNEKVQAEIDELMPSIEENEKLLSNLNNEIEIAQNEYDELENRFQSTYEAYCYRLKVIYISGQFNIISALIGCKDLSGFLTRYEMIRSVSKSDARLLKEVSAKMEEITTKRNGLNEKKTEFESKKAELDKQKKELVSKQKNIEKNTQSIADKKVMLAKDRAESDRLLAELTAQNKQYTEYRNEDEELIAAVENEIQLLISGIITTEQSTTAPSSNKDKNNPVIKDSDSDVYSKSDAVLNMTYPVPSHHSVSAGFPNYSSGKYHGGIDFPCPTGSKVVAAQKGIVITVKRLDYSYGYYVMIYHGTDALGRSVVTLYAHNSSILVSVGESVKKGQPIAKSGSTGNSTGPHCHFEVRLDGTRFNPRNYLS